MLEEEVLQFHLELEGDVVELDHDDAQQKVIRFPFPL
jgi:hypothetical protein